MGNEPFLERITGNNPVDADCLVQDYHFHDLLQRTGYLLYIFLSLLEFSAEQYMYTSNNSTSCSNNDGVVCVSDFIPFVRSFRYFINLYID